MQLKLPRPKDAPPRRKRAPIVSATDAPPCGICQNQQSRYTCPQCNLSYCSLACFRAPEHQACAETFSRTTLAEDLGGDAPGADVDKRQMMEILKKFEEQQRGLEEVQAAGATEVDPRAEEDAEEDDSPEAEERRRERDELEKKLAEIDLDSLPPEQILSLLTPAQQEAFTEALRDPARVNKLVEDEFEGDEPWWVIEQERKAFEEFRDANKAAAQRDEPDQEEAHSAATEEPDVEWEDIRPPLLDAGRLPALKAGPDGKAIANPHLLHNIVAVLFAYSFTLRTFSFTSLGSIPIRSPERITIVQELARLLPFLVQRSTASFEGLEEAVEYVAAREGAQGMSPPLVGILLQDVASLLRPAPISAIQTAANASPLASHALVNLLAALSDVHALFATAIAPPSDRSSATKAGTTTVSAPLIARPSTTSPLSKQERQQCALASAKLLFYASFATSTGREVVQACGASSALAERDAARRMREEEAREDAVARRKAQLRETGGADGSGAAGRGRDATLSDMDGTRDEAGGGQPTGKRSEPGEGRKAASRGPRIVELE